MRVWICKDCGEEYENGQFLNLCPNCSNPLKWVFQGSEEYLKNKYKYFDDEEIPENVRELLETYEY